MTAQTPLSKDDPRMVAWEKYKETKDYENAHRWALYVEHQVSHPHIDGSLWAMFQAGFEAGQNQEFDRMIITPEKQNSDQVTDAQLQRVANNTARQIVKAVEAEIGKELSLELSLSFVQMVYDAWCDLRNVT